MWPTCDQCFSPGSMKVDSLFRITDTKVESPSNLNPGINKAMPQMNITYGS